MALFALSGGGAALLADADTPTSAVTHAGGKILAIPFWIFRRGTVEHRGVTHTLLAGVALAVGVYFLGHLFAQRHGWLPAYWPIRIVIPTLLGMLAVRSVLTFGSEGTWRLGFKTHRRRFVIAVIGLAVGYYGYVLGPTPHFALGMVLAVGIGYFSHLLMDAVMGGVPAFSPLTGGLSHRIVLGRFKVEGVLDRLCGVVFLATAIYLFLRPTSFGLPLHHVLHLTHL
jgi:hypothetical protein